MSKESKRDYTWLPVLAFGLVCLATSIYFSIKSHQARERTKENWRQIDSMLMEIKLNNDTILNNLKK